MNKRYYLQDGRHWPTLVLCLCLCLALLSGCALTTEPAELDPIAMSKKQMTSVVVPPYEIPDSVQQALLPRQAYTSTSKSKKRLDIKANASPVSAFFSSLSAASGINIVVDPNVLGTISLSMTDVTLSEILRAIRDTYGYDFKATAYGYRVSARTLQTRIFSLNYLKVKREGSAEIKVSGNGLKQTENASSSDASDTGTTTSEAASIKTSTNSDFWDEIKTLLSEMVSKEGGRQVVVDANAGIIMVKAFPDEIGHIEDFINTIQNSIQRQVVIEAKIIEVQLNKDFQQGIQWDTFGAGVGSGATFAASGRPFAANLTTSPNAPADLLNYDMGGIFSLSFNYKNDFAGAIKLLQTQGDVRVLSSPRISTINNQKAVIKVGVDEFFVTDVSSTTTATSNTTNQTPEVTLTPFFSGIALDVTPQIGSNDEITLHVHPSVTEVIEQKRVLSIFDQTLELPLALSSVRETDSIIRAKDGQVVVMGGLLKNEVYDVEVKVPVLSDLPWIGKLFTQIKQVHQKIELVILLKPVIMEQPEWNKALEELKTNFPYWQSGRKPNDDEYLFQLN